MLAYEGTPYYNCAPEDNGTQNSLFFRKKRLLLTDMEGFICDDQNAYLFSIFKDSKAFCLKMTRIYEKQINRHTELFQSISDSCKLPNSKSK